MDQNFANSIELLEVSASKNLYKNLVAQLLKDFGLANIEWGIADDVALSDFLNLLHEKVYVLHLERFSDYLNLLYVVDVPEKEMKSIAITDVVEVTKQVCFIILKREWQKVWSKHKYSL